MRSNPLRNNGSVVVWLVIINLAVFVLQNILETTTGQDYLKTAFGLSVTGLNQGKVHAFITYGFLHASIVHIAFNMLILFFMGRAIEPLLGTKQFLGLYFGAVFAGGIAWFLVHAFSGSNSILLGASAGVVAVLIFFCLLRPNEPVDFLLFFIIPVRLKPKWITMFVVGWTLIGLFFMEIPGQGSGGQMTAHSAHLGGIIGAWIFFKYCYLQRPLPFGRSIHDDPPYWSESEPPTRSERKQSARKEKEKVDREKLRGEVDRVLDKINEHGFGALSEEEKALLDRAREILNK